MHKIPTRVPFPLRGIASAEQKLRTRVPRKVMANRGKSTYLELRPKLSDEALACVLPSGDSLGTVLSLNQRLAGLAVKKAHAELGIPPGSRPARANIEEILKKAALDPTKWWKQPEGGRDFGD